MKILFIGNSYTFYNDLPGTLAAICRENGIELQADSVTKGAYTLSHFLSEENEYGQAFRRKLAENRYDYIVLQEQSLRPAEHPETFLRALDGLMPLLRGNGAQPVLYETWGRRDGTAALERHGWTHEEMQRLLRESYEKGADAVNAVLVYAGERLHEAYRGADGDAVYNEDGSHPSPLGTRIVAREFYRTLFGEK